MTYLLWYLVIGLVVAVPLAGGQAKEMWTSRSQENSFTAKELMSLALVILVTALFWLLIVPYFTFEILSHRRNEKQRKNDERVFAPSDNDLICRFTIEEIQAQEVVDDPLCGAPRIAFGHLNDAWQKFLTELPAGAELWSYAVVWEYSWRSQEQREGYVAVHSGSVGNFFETVVYRLEDQA